MEGEDTVQFMKSASEKPPAAKPWSCGKTVVILNDSSEPAAEKRGEEAAEGDGEEGSGDSADSHGGVDDEDDPGVGSESDSGEVEA